jgi:hypothetical protein
VYYNTGENKDRPGEKPEHQASMQSSKGMDEYIKEGMNNNLS